MTTTTKRNPTMRGALLLALAALAASVLVLAASSAEAAFPGSNGAVAFVASDQIYRMNPDGLGQSQLSDTPGTNLRPDWSADGKKTSLERES